MENSNDAPAVERKMDVPTEVLKEALAPIQKPIPEPPQLKSYLLKDSQAMPVLEAITERFGRYFQTIAREEGFDVNNVQLNVSFTLFEPPAQPAQQ